MTSQPLDGNAIAADRHYDRDEPLHDGAPCPFCEDGVIEVTPPEEDCPRGAVRCVNGCKEASE